MLLVLTHSLTRSLVTAAIRWMHGWMDGCASMTTDAMQSTATNVAAFAQQSFFVSIGANYTLSFYYCTRTAYSVSAVMSVYLQHTQVWTAGTVTTAVTSWTHVQLSFVATQSTVTVAFMTMATANVDSSMLVDDVSVTLTSPASSLSSSTGTMVTNTILTQSFETPTATATASYVALPGAYDL